MSYIPVIVFIVLLFLFVLLMFRNYFKKVTVIPTVLPQEGFLVPVFSVARGGFWWRVHNSVWPKFRLYDDRLSVLIIGTTTKKYSEIKSIRSARYIFPTLVISFVDEPWELYIAMNGDNLLQVISFFRSKNLPIST